jgi:two-component system chemotaxis response regulator CheY
VPREILVVDDDPLVRDYLRLKLEGAGYVITCACDGAEAIRVIASRRFDLVLTDLLMPEKDGFEVIGEVRRQQPEARIIAMSGGGSRSRMDYLDLAESFGAYPLRKPFSSSDLQCAIELVLAVA